MIYRDTVKGLKDYILVEYLLESKTTLADAAWNLAIGQSVGNPNIRNKWETQDLFDRHSCLIIGNEEKLKTVKHGVVTIAFPVVNFNFKEDGITQLLVQVMGGQLDIDIITKCHIRHISYPRKIHEQRFYPKYGVRGIRDFTQVQGKPLLGGIVKPKIGISPEGLLDVVKEMVDGGVNFIKEDEIMSNPACCPLEDRLPKVMNYLDGKKVIYAACINSDFPYLTKRVEQVRQLGGNAVHVNFWNGLGAYKTIREMDLPLFLFFQKSGDKILTNPSHAFHIEWTVLVQMACLCGIDFIHAGMWGGYSTSDDSELMHTLTILQTSGVMPSLSCGMHPGLVQAINGRFGVDYLANCGGALHGHPDGTIGGARAMRQAIDATGGPEYDAAIAKWGLVE